MSRCARRIELGPLIGAGTLPVTWPTFQISYGCTVPSKPITAPSIIYGGARPDQLAVPRWANAKLILEILVPHPISLAIRTSI